MKSFIADGRSVNIYQGGYMRAHDFDFLMEIGIGLVVNVTSNINAPDWIGQSDVPRWLRFILPEYRRDTQVLPEFSRFTNCCPTRSCAARMSSFIAAQEPIAQALARPRML